MKDIELAEAIINWFVCAVVIRKSEWFWMDTAALSIGV